MVLLFGVKHIHLTLILFSNYKKKGVRAISFQPHMSPSLPIFNDLKLLKLSEIFELRPLTFVFDSAKKLHLVAFMTSSYLAHLFLIIPQDRPVKVIYICLEKTASNMV